MTVSDSRPLPDSARSLLDSAALVHLVTLNPDGSPNVTGVWAGLDGDDVVFASMYPWRKTKNLQHDPRAALSVESPDFYATGMREYLIVYGTVEVTEGGGPALLDRLAKKYLGPEAEYPPPELRSLAGYVMRLRVERISGVGPWKGDPPGTPEGYRQYVASAARKSAS
jgi:PPOX class probable F420-dependent enzyme